MCVAVISPDVPKVHRLQPAVILQPQVEQVLPVHLPQAVHHHQAIAQAVLRAVAAAHPPLLPHLHLIIVAVLHRQVAAAVSAVAAHRPAAVMAAEVAADVTD